MLRLRAVLAIFLWSLAVQAQTVCVAMPQGPRNWAVRQAIVAELQKRKVDAADCSERKAAVELNWYPQPFISESTSYWFMAEVVPVTPNSAIGAVTITPQPALTANGYVLWLEQNGQVLYREERAGQLSVGLKHVARYLTKKKTCIGLVCVKPVRGGAK